MFKNSILGLETISTYFSLIIIFNNVAENFTQHISKMSSVRINAVTIPVTLGEGPYWNAESQSLYFVDINSGKIFNFIPSTGYIVSSSIGNGTISFIIGVEGEQDYYIIGYNRSLTLIKWPANQNASIIRSLVEVDSDSLDTRFNDGKIDSYGRFWGGTMGRENYFGVALNRGSLYIVNSNLKAEKKLSQVTISNGLAWSVKNNIMYYIDSPTRKILSFKFKAHDGIIANPRIVFDFDKYNLTGVPDGMTIDENDNLWVASYGGSCVLNIDPRKGNLLHIIPIPATKVTSVTFGGQNLDTLYVTTALFGLNTEEKENETEPFSGCVFAVHGLGVKGFLANKFKFNSIQ